MNNKTRLEESLDEEMASKPMAWDELLPVIVIGCLGVAFWIGFFEILITKGCNS